jgi:hypothetical protein
VTLPDLGYCPNCHHGTVVSGTEKRNVRCEELLGVEVVMGLGRWWQETVNRVLWCMEERPVTLKHVLDIVRAR